MKTFKIDKNNENQRLDKFMSKVMPEAGAGIIYKSLRKKRVKVNGKRITDGNHRLFTGDLIELYINDEYFADAKPVARINRLPEPDVVYEDDRIIVMNKPSGLLSQTEKGDSLEGRMRNYLYSKGVFELGGIFIPSLCHRIDRNTSGLVIGAKDGEALRILNEKIRNREIRKFYICETENTPAAVSGEIKGWLIKNEKDRRMIFSENKLPGATACHTLYKVLQKGNPAVVEIELLSGKTHQIRAGFGHIGCPLVGDVKYGAKNNDNRNYQHLVAYKLIFMPSKEKNSLSYLDNKEIIIKGGVAECFR